MIQNLTHSAQVFGVKTASVVRKRFAYKSATTEFTVVTGGHGCLKVIDREIPFVSVPSVVEPLAADVLKRQTHHTEVLRRAPERASP